jgi:ABC-2 type transport system ATP-binding protein
VGYLPDSVDFYENLTGRQNLRYTARLNEIEPRTAEGRIDELLDRVGLAEHADRPVGGYSRGMRQRLGLADTLLKDPRVVILDEPMVGIDPAGVQEMQDMITGLARDDGRAVLLTSHMLHQVQQTCDRMAIFVAGRIVAEGTASELAANLSGDEVAFELVTTDPGERVRSALQQQAGNGAAQIERLGANRWRVTVPADHPPVLPALVRSGVTVTEFRSLGASLDEIYRRYFVAAERSTA